MSRFWSLSVQLYWLRFLRNSSSGSDIHLSRNRFFICATPNLQQGFLKAFTSVHTVLLKTWADEKQCQAAVLRWRVTFLLRLLFGWIKDRLVWRRHSRALMMQIDTHAYAPNDKRRKRRWGYENRGFFPSSLLYFFKPGDLFYTVKFIGYLGDSSMSIYLSNWSCIIKISAHFYFENADFTPSLSSERPEGILLLETQAPVKAGPLTVAPSEGTWPL